MDLPRLTDAEMAAKLGRPTKRLEFVLLDEDVFHRDGDEWEAYPREDEDEPPADQ